MSLNNIGSYAIATYLRSVAELHLAELSIYILRNSLPNFQFPSSKKSNQSINQSISQSILIYHLPYLYFLFFQISKKAMSPVILILGSGSNVGSHVAKSFIAKGYKVAHVSRKPKEENNTADEINIVGDFSDPESIGTIFSKVKQSLGLPSVVVYNGKLPTSQV